ncbi:glycosyltransferase [Cellulosimicrobium cellulans]|uniref:glycosyltransferase n=1 Tax=Cellulosimicrobium cellulans TaxID=1710 RepID=UPI001EDAA640|nr:glycosyltransferase [Cellulosimicrobium cellulans]UKJ65535.1 glycosyltransferase [Cellulosimicrobium cellulans]
MASGGGPLGRFVQDALGHLAGGGARAGSPPPVPETPVRLYIGPTNYAGQGYLWARAAERELPGVGAVNMVAEVEHGFRFPADDVVPVATYLLSRPWQVGQRRYVERFTHVLVEAERPLLGRLHGGDAFEEARVMREAGLHVAMMCHGTDVRLPSRHRAGHAWSPFDDDPAAAALEDVARKNIEGLASLGAPVFVSTPDLLDDVPDATWCPVVVDPARWSPSARVLERARPLVVHVPSSSTVKGTQLIAPVLEKLAERGVIDFRYVEGVAAADMPALYGEADIVLDQFRIGSYGVAACEAMAAGRVVVGHVSEAVRSHVLRTTGAELPIVEATPDTLEDVVTSVLEDRETYRRRAARGVEFVTSVHDGRTAARALRPFLLEAHP